MLTGDERNLGPRDGGQVRRFVRDVVDARFNVSEFFLLIALAVVIVVLGPQLLGLSTVLTAQFQLVTTAVLWITIALVALDEVRLVLRLRKALRERFGADFDTRGHVSYGVSRSLQIRRWRLPRPAVSRGQAPRS